ncbi:MAG: radical SAM protein [Anaerolineae bacterium]
MMLGFISQSVNGFRSLFSHDLDFLIFFVTSICNAKCGHCFYWQNLNAPDEGFALGDIEKLARSMPRFRTLLISGGEPFLREDLPAVIGLFRRINDIEHVGVPSNGILAGRTTRLARQILQENPGLDFTVNLSIDGFAETHDKIRGVPRNFELTLNTMQHLLELRDEFPHFGVWVNTVICADNYDEVIPFARWMRDRFPIGGHFFEVVRGEPMEPHLKSVPPEKLRDIYEAVLPIQEAYLRKRLERQGASNGRRLWREVNGLGALAFQYHTQYTNYAHGRRWDMDCLAGEAIAVIDYNANVRVCELREAQIALADYDHDFSKLIQDPVMQSEREAAKSHGCDCTHVCFINTTLQHDWQAKLIHAPFRYAKYRLTGTF